MDRRLQVRGTEAAPEGGRADGEPVGGVDFHDRTKARGTPDHGTFFELGVIGE